MVTVSFVPVYTTDTIDSYDDLGLFLSDVTITEPEAKRTLIDVPCRDGALDLSYALSDELYFKNRKLTLTFKKTDYTNSWLTVFSEIASQLHGQKMWVTFSSDPDYRWTAFVTVDPSSAYNVGTIKVILDAYPFKQQVITKTTGTTSAGVTVHCPVTMRSTHIEVTTMLESCTITYDGTTYTFSAGVNMIPDFRLQPGDNELIVKGSGGSVTIVYYDGVF